MESSLCLTHRQRPEGKQFVRGTILNTTHCKPTAGQRLIPLTKEIIHAMMDFNGSQSSTSISEKPFYNTFSITSLVREEVHNILHELSISDQFIRKEEIDDLIERCLKEKVTLVQDDESKTTTIPSESDTNQEIEVTVEMLNESDKNKLIVENFQILEQRITNLEERISTMLQTIPKLRHIQAKKFKINTEAIREELRQFMDKMESGHDSVICEEKTTEDIDVFNPYDDVFYEQRQNKLNLLNYKKSIATLELNERPRLNPYIRPMKIQYPEITYKQKRRPMFICSE